ncbi:hypothetical protein [Secundilactobacillus collinoides]|uniref:hypothetical protein n=1 Tax=Secundilactobacillus collinoides TaxID=33960 RepID=UPI0006D0A130|nr:hypothetical protein [Secundilactobacillus collinoides]
MTTLFVHQTDAEQPVKLSDGTAGLVERCKTPDGNNGYLFKFFLINCTVIFGVTPLQMAKR